MSGIMNPLLWSNLIAYFLQIGLLIALASFVPSLLRVRMPGAKLVFLQLLLAACLLLPLVRPWHRETILRTTGIVGPVAASAPASAPRRARLPVSEIALAILCVGAVARFAWLAAGFWRLRRYRRHSRPLEPQPAWSVEAEIRLSDEIASPVMFGLRHPVILLPGHFPQLAAGLQDAILCHEVLHVRRRDWLFTLGEELVRSVFWFHPAIWWLLGEIQLAREQAVDREAIDLTRSPEQYVDALLAIAGAAPGAAMQLDLAPAPLFLRKRHLKQRVISILKEVRMSKLRTISTFTAGLAALAASCWLVTGAFPLSAAPQVTADSVGVTVDTNGSQLLHRSAVPYPIEAIKAGAQGTVVVQVRLDGSGNVTDASVLSGPEQLRKPVLQSVLNWHFTKDAANSTRQVSVTFQPSQQTAALQQSNAALERALTEQRKRASGFASATPLGRISSIDFRGLSDSAVEELRGKLNVHVGDTLTPETTTRLTETAKQFDEHLNVGMRVSPSGDVGLTISSPGANAALVGGILGSVPSSAPPPPAFPNAVPVNGADQQAKLISQEQPAYPALAKQARVQGSVDFAVIIGAGGQVKDIKVVKGHPLLIQAAIAAVKNWVYQPTLLNGQPVAVSTTVTVDFTLSQ